MTRISSFLTFAAVVLVAPLAGQGSRSADGTATVVIAPSLELHIAQDLIFGPHFASEGVIATDESRFALWEGSTDPGTEIGIAFTALPTQLTRVGGTEFLPISYGATSATARDGDSFAIASFNPVTGLASFLIPGPSNLFQVFLGAPFGNPTDIVSVDLTGKPAATYQATITLTVTVQ